MKRNSNRQTTKRRTKAPKVKRNLPRKQPSAGNSITRGLAGIANQFIPGAGGLVSGVSKLLGFGAYTTQEAETILASRVPSMNATLDRGIRVAHHEYLGDVSSATAFTIQKYPINPGQASTFPWLSSVASAFQEYELNGCVFYFKSTSANALNSTNTALGQIIGAVQYNPYLPAPVDKIQMLGLSSASDGKPSESNIYPVECKADMVVFRSKLLRVGVVADDLAKYDHGNFFLGANGSQAVAIVGELHVVYDITLKKPKLNREGAAVDWYWHAWSNDSIATGLTPLLSAAISTKGSLPVVFTAPNVLKMDAMSVVAGTSYRFRALWSGTAANITQPIVTFTNATAVADLFGASVSIASPINGVSSTRLMVDWVVRANISNTDITITVGAAGTIPTNSNWDLVLTEIINI